MRLTKTVKRIITVAAARTTVRQRTRRADRRLRSATPREECRSHAAERVTAKKSSLHVHCSLIRERLGAEDCSAQRRSVPCEASGYALTNASNASQCRGCGTFAPARMREHAASESPVALPISLSEKASSFGTISRLNHASSRCSGCSRAQLRLRRCPSLIASPRTRFTAAPRRGSLPAAVSAARAYPSSGIQAATR